MEAQPEAEAAWQPAAVGQTLLAGGGARTGQAARARLDISDGTIIRLAAATEFRLVEFAPAHTDPVTRLGLDAGKVWVMVTTLLGLGKFEVETPVGVAGVRGSLMSVDYDPASGQMTVTCLEGQCYLAEAGGTTTDLTAGEQAEIMGPGQPPTARHPMDDTQLVDWAREFPEAQAAVAAATAAPRPTATPAPQSACDHPYFPLRQGATWQRSRPSGPRTWVVAAISGDLGSAHATIADSNGTTTLTYTWHCTTDGLAYFRLEDIARLVATVQTFYNTVDSLYGTDSASDLAAINYTLSDEDGMSLPPPGSLTAGAVWTHRYTVRYTGQPSAVSDAYITYSLEVAETHTAGEAQTLATAAGTFTVIPVVIQATSTKTSEFSHGARGFGKIGPNSETAASTTTVYYAAGVGLVRSEWVSGADSLTSDLESYSLP